jgi:hypothetical protein
MESNPNEARLASRSIPEWVTSDSGAMQERLLPSRARADQGSGIRDHGAEEHGTSVSHLGNADTREALATDPAAVAAGRRDAGEEQALTRWVG